MQAEKELGADWTLQKADVAGVLELPAWLAKNLPSGSRVGVDPFLHTIDGARKLQKVHTAELRPEDQALLRLFLRCPNRAVISQTCRGLSVTFLYHAHREAYTN